MPESQEGILNPERVENSQGRMPRVSLKAEAEIRENDVLLGLGKEQNKHLNALFVSTTENEKLQR